MAVGEVALLDSQVITLHLIRKRLLFCEARLHVAVRLRLVVQLEMTSAQNVERGHHGVFGVTLIEGVLLQSLFSQYVRVLRLFVVCKDLRTPL